MVKLSPSLMISTVWWNGCGSWEQIRPKLFAWRRAWITTSRRKSGRELMPLFGAGL